MTRGLLVVALCAGLLAACGNNNETNNSTSNNSTSNNSTSNNSMSNNSASNNTASNNTTGQSPVEPADLSCSEFSLTPTGAVADTAGLWKTTDSCLGDAPLRPIYQLCEGAVFSRYDNDIQGYYFASGNQLILAQTADSDLEAWVPGECVAQIGTGDCPAVETLLGSFLAETEGSTLGCEPSAGGCLCTASVTTELFRAGTAVETGTGAITLETFDENGDVDTDDWTFEVNQDMLTTQRDTGEIFELESSTDDATLALYCAGFMVNCNEVVGDAGYDDYADCEDRAGTLTVAGSEQTTGDSIECRLYHLLASADTSDAGNQATHCPHAQFAPTEVCVD